MNADAVQIVGRWSRWLPPWRWLWPLAVLVALWAPEALHYRIDRSPVSTPIPPALTSQPADAVLDELASFDLGELQTWGFTPAAAVRAVDERSVYIEGLTPQRLPVLGQPQDLTLGPPTYQLFASGMAIERMLVQAYREGFGERYLAAAVARARSLAEHELNARHDNRFLWNDHAVANRASALIALWQVMRADPTLRDAHASWLLSFVQRTGRMLAKPDQFTVRTNHGVMQNLALLQLAAAFPSLVEASGWQRTALARLHLQLDFYVSPEGVILEHSPGYHVVGTKLLTYATRLVALNGLPASPRLSQAMSASRAVLARLMRPDGTVPPIGNTDSGFSHHIPTLAAADAPMTWVPPPDASVPADSVVYPAAGWAVLWSGNGVHRQSQLMATWAKHDGHGHKRADEGALTWWVNGRELLGTVGYWPYGHPLVRQSYGWRSSNAAHAPGEAANSPRRPELLASGLSDGLQILDMARGSVGGPTFRRQVLLIGDAALLVLDFTKDSPLGTEVLWTLGRDIVNDRSRSGDHVVVSQPLSDGHRLAISVAADRVASTRLVRGMRQPFGGWTTSRGIVTPVDAVEVTVPERDSVMVALFQRTRHGQPVAVPPLQADATPSDWQLSFDLDGQRLTLKRTGETVALHAQGDTPVRSQTLRLDPPPPAAAAMGAELRAAYLRGVAEFPPWRDLWRYREQVSAAVLALLVLQEIAVAVISRRVDRGRVRTAIGLNVAVAIIWAWAATWIFAVYLVV